MGEHGLTLYERTERAAITGELPPEFEAMRLAMGASTEGFRQHLRALLSMCEWIGDELAAQPRRSAMHTAYRAKTRRRRR